LEGKKETSGAKDERAERKKVLALAQPRKVDVIYNALGGGWEQ
jgi:hypothetical protein